jgi:hypothetical protein
MQRDHEATIEIPVSLVNKLMDDLRRLEICLNLQRQEESPHVADTRAKRKSR